MTNITKTEKSIQNKVNLIQYAEPFISALGDPSTYAYSGNWFDTGCYGASKCICNHPVRYLFEITNGKNKAFVGSTCIEHFQIINPELYESLLEAKTALESALAEAKRKAREAGQDVEIQELLPQYQILRNQMIDTFKNLYQKENIRSPYLMWVYVCHYTKKLPEVAPEFTKKGNYVRWYKKSIEKIQEVMSMVKNDTNRTRILSYRKKNEEEKTARQSFWKSKSEADSILSASKIIPF